MTDQNPEINVLTVRLKNLEEVEIPLKLDQSEQAVRNADYTLLQECNTRIAAMKTYAENLKAEIARISPATEIPAT